LKYFRQYLSASFSLKHLKLHGVDFQIDSGDLKTLTMGLSIDIRYLYFEEMDATVFEALFKVSSPSLDHLVTSISPVRASHFFSFYNPMLVFGRMKTDDHLIRLITLWQLDAHFVSTTALNFPTKC